MGDGPPFLDLHENAIQFSKSDANLNKPPRSGLVQHRVDGKFVDINSEIISAIII